MDHTPWRPGRVINAWGTATPYGVSRSAPEVAAAVGAVLQRHVVMAELQAQTGRALAAWSAAPAGCVTHCTAAAVTLAVAACMAGADATRIAQLPDAAGMRQRVAMLAVHQVNYGQPLVQAVRLAGAQPVLCADAAALRRVLDEGAAGEGTPGTGGIACVLVVESHLAAGSGPAVTRELAEAAHRAGVPLVLDAAAQDWRVRELVAGGADLVLLSGQKYLAGPTAGLVVGRADLVAAVEAQHAGIGRAMKPTKEALAGVLAALALRATTDTAAWRDAQRLKAGHVLAAARGWPGVTVERVPDPQGNGFERLWLAIDPAVTGRSAGEVNQALRGGDPVVAVAPHRLAQGQIGLELTGVTQEELAPLCAAIARALQLPASCL